MNKYQVRRGLCIHGVTVRKSFFLHISPDADGYMASSDIIPMYGTGCTRQHAIQHCLFRLIDEMHELIRDGWNLSEHLACNLAILQEYLDTDEEREWHEIVQKPQCKEAFRRMAVRVKQQIKVGETEKGGFGIELANSEEE